MQDYSATGKKWKGIGAIMKQSIPAVGGQCIIKSGDPLSKIYVQKLLEHLV